MFESGRELLMLAEGEEREVSRRAARVLAHLAEFVLLHKDVDRELVRLEVAAVFRWSPAHARRKIDLAVALTTRLPATFTAFREGRIDENKARRIAATTEPLTGEHAALVESVVVGMAEALTVRQLNYRLRRTIAKVDPEGVAQRAASAREERRVRHAALNDEVGVIRVQGDVERTQLAFDRVRVIARQVKAGGDVRTLDQIMADVALDSLVGEVAGAVKEHVWLRLLPTTGSGRKQGRLPRRRRSSLHAADSEVSHSAQNESAVRTLQTHDGSSARTKAA